MWAYKKDKKNEANRSVAFGEFAKENGFAYYDAVEFETLGIPEKARFLSWGSPTKIENVLKWEEGGVRVTVFLYTYQNKLTFKSSYGESILYLNKTGANLPWFRSWPRKRREDSWRHKGWEQIFTGGDQPFFRDSIIKSKQRETVEKMLSKVDTERLHLMKDCTIEGFDDHLIILPHTFLIPDQNLKTMVSNAATLLNALAETR